MPYITEEPYFIDTQPREYKEGDVVILNTPQGIWYENFPQIIGKKIRNDGRLGDVYEIHGKILGQPASPFGDGTWWEQMMRPYCECAK